MRILLITWYFPPDAHIASHRWARFSRELARRGHAITVITPERNCGPSNPFRCEQCGEALPDVDQVVRVKGPPLFILLCSISAIAGKCRSAMRKRVAGVRSRLPGRSRAPLPATEHRQTETGDLGSTDAVRSEPAAAAGFWTTTRRRFSRQFYFPNQSWRWADRVVHRVTRMPDHNSYDLIIGTHPYIGTLRAACLISKQTGTPWVADLRDPIHNQHHSIDMERSRRLAPLEETLLNDASAVITINRQLAKMLLTRRPVSVIPQSFSATTHDGTWRAVKDRAIRTVYIGSIQPGCRYGDFFHGLRKLPPAPSTAEIEIRYLGSDYAAIESFESEVGGRGIRIINQGFVDAATCAQAMADADLLLVFGWGGPGYQCVLTGKVFDYLAAGKPIVAVTYPDSALADLIDETGAGVVLTSAEQVTEFVAELRENPDAVVARLHAARNEDQIRQYATHRVVDQLETLLEKTADEARR